MKPQDHTHGEQLANPIDHAAIGRRANFHREELRYVVEGDQ